MTYYDNLRGGSRQRLARMRAYVDKWNADLRHRTKLEGFKDARSHGIGSIRIDAHGPRASECGFMLHLPLSVAEGWRDRGDANDIVSLRHTGWFRDVDQCETYCGHVWQLPTSRSGELLYIAGVIDRDGAYVTLSATGGRLDFYDSAEDAAHAADGLAQSMAEDEREHNEKWHAARDAESAIEDAHAEMRTIRQNVAGQFALLRAGKGSRDGICDYVAKLREEFAELLESIREHRDTLDDLRLQGID